MNMRYDDFTLIIPTLNEEKNIGRMLQKIALLYPGMRIIVVDDGSTDSTRGIVGKVALNNDNVVLLDRSGKRRGLTASVVEAMLKTRTKFIAVMDADFQHPVDKLRTLANRMHEGSDMAVAVRTDVKDWELYRRIISRTLIKIGECVLYFNGDESCRDIFSGFFAVKRNLATRIIERNRNRFVLEGYKVLFDMLKCMKRGSARISEVPYAFGSRKEGKSKASFVQGFAVLKSFFS